MSRFPEEAFRRYDEAPDEEFYETPRLVTHIDDRAIAAVTQLYREFFLYEDGCPVARSIKHSIEITSELDLSTES